MSAREYVALERKKRELKQALGELEKQIELQEAALLAEFAQDGVQSIKVDGMTVYVHRQLWAKAKDGDYDRACAALEAAGLGALVQRRFNANQVSALVREWDEQGEALRPELVDALDIAEVFSARVRSGK